MKLSEIATGPTPTAQGWEGTEQAVIHAGEEKAYAAQQGGKMLGDIGHEANDVLDTIKRVQLTNAATDEKTKTAALKNELDQRKIYATMKDVDDAFGGYDNVPQSIKDQYGPDATNIPGFAVNGELYKKRRAEITAKSAENLQVPGWKDQFIRQGNQEGAFEAEQMKSEYQKEAQHFEVANADNAVSKYINSGDFVSPVKLLNGELMVNGVKVPAPNISPEQKEKTIQLIKQAEGEYGMQVPMRGTDKALIQSTIDGLNSGNNTFVTKDAYGKENMVDVSAISTDQRREKTRMLRQYLDHLNKGDKEAERDYYAKNDRELIINFTKAGMEGGLSGMLQVQRQMYQTPGLYSESAFKYVAGAIESKANISHTREKTEDPTTTPNNAHASVVTTLANNPNGHLIGPDKKDWGPVQDVDLQKYSAAYKIPPGQLSELQKQQQQARKGEPVDEKWQTQTIDRYLDANKATADTTTSQARNIRGEFHVVIPQMLKKEDDERRANGQSPMTKDEKEKAIQEFIQQAPEGSKLQGTDKWFAPNQERADTMAPNELVDTRDFDTDFSNKYGFHPLPNKSDEWLAFNQRVKLSMEPMLKKSGLMRNMTPQQIHRVAQTIEVFRPQLEKELEKEGKGTSRSDVIRRFFEKKNYIDPEPISSTGP